MEAKTSSGAIAGYHVILPKLDKNRDSVSGSFWARICADPLAGWVGLDASRTLVAQAVGPTWFIKCLMVSYLIFAAVAPADFRALHLSEGIDQ